MSLFLVRVAGRIGTQQITADDDFGLNHGLASKDDIRGADDLGAPGDFVACVLGKRSDTAASNDGGK